MNKTNETPWYNRGATGEYLRDWADCLLHGHGEPDTKRFVNVCKKVGLTDKEIGQVLVEELEEAA